MYRLSILLFLHLTGSAFAADALTVSSIAELQKSAIASGQKVRMKPGVYQMTDHISLDEANKRRKSGPFQLLTFSGSGNHFDLTGVTIELDTELRHKLNPPIHTDEILISGKDNTLQGLTLRHVGDGNSNGGAALGITGVGNALVDCTLHVRGSHPYGYGDLFGKGGRKHSGVHITGDGTHIKGCRLFMDSFGHGFYLQEDAADCLLEDCLVVGKMRRSDEMLAETSGMAIDRNFRSEVSHRGGEKRILPGYMKALSEDGFRTYGEHPGLVLKNCTARNMRGGFELRTRKGATLENCTVTGCERGFWLSSDAQASGCQGDASYGPLLYVEGDNATVEVTLLPDVAPGIQVHAVAAIRGTGNTVSINQKGQHSPARPIFIGYGAPPMGENMAEYSEQIARDNTLKNNTSMPVVIGGRAERTQITGGTIQQDSGKETTH